MLLRSSIARQRYQSIAIAMISLGMVTTLLSVGYLHLQSYTEDLKQLHTLTNELEQVDMALLQLRSLENRYHLSRSEESRRAFEQAKKKLSHDLAQHEQHESLAPVLLQEFHDLTNQLDQYHALLNKIDVMYRTYGKSAQDGLYFESRQAAHALEALILEQQQLYPILLNMRRREKDFQLRGDEEYLRSFETLAAQLHSALQQAENPQFDQPAALQQLNTYRQHHQSLVDVSVMITEAQQQLEQHVVEIGRSQQSIVQAMKVLQANGIRKALNELRSYLLSSGIIMIVIIIYMLLSRLFDWRILANLVKDTRNTINTLSENSSDLSTRLHPPKAASQEVKQLAHATNIYIKRLQEMLQGVGSTADRLGELSDTGLSLKQEIFAIIQQQLDAAQEAAQHLEASSTTLHSLGERSQRLSDNMVQARELTQTSQEHVHKLDGEMAQLQQQSSDAAQSMRQLAEQVSEINSVAEVIASIAEQTNLLALNAAIEAARAGESGRGFAVVADEVRSLAQRTAESTSTIRQQVESIQKSCDDCVTQVDSSAASVSSSIDISAQVSSDLHTIGTSINELRDEGNMLAKELQLLEDSSHRLASSNQSLCVDVSSSADKALEALTNDSDLSQYTTHLRHLLRGFDKTLKQTDSRHQGDDTELF